MNTLKNKGLVSVIIPLYGEFNPERIKMCIDSIKNQRGVDLEIVVVEQSKEPQLLGLMDITYLHQTPTLSEDGFYVPGRVRNTAGKIARGEFIYNNDGDILFFNEGYLKQLIALLTDSPNLCLYQPPMRRLPIENFEEFKRRFNSGGIKLAISTLDLSQPHGATYTNQPIRIRHFKKMVGGKEEISVATETDHRKYLSGQNKGKEPFFYTLEIHAGGILMKNSQFDRIGGYCEDYAGWGCHDEDIQWKLRTLFDLQKIPNKKDLEVLHLDHPRPYFSEVRWTKNREIQKNRKNFGVGPVTISDRERLYGTG